MKLHVKYTAQLRSVLERSEETVEFAEACSLEVMLKRLAEANPAAQAHLLNASGQINPCLLLVVNNTAIAAADASSRQLHDGDVVLLLPPIAGG